MKKFIKGFLLLLVTLAVAPKMDVKAATYSDVINDGGNWIANNYVVKEHGSTRKYQQMNIITRRSDGHFVYCVQPGVPIQEKTVTGYDSDWAIVSNMTQAQWNRVSQLAYYGYGYQDANHNHTDKKWYAITQFMIWHSVPTKYDIYFTDTLNGNRITKYTSEMQEIENLLAQHHKVPSFNQTNTSMFIGETKSFNDSNSVLSNVYIVKSFDGGSASINGNSLNITANKVGKFDVILAKNNNRYGIAPIIYVDPTSQNVFSRGDVDPTYAKLNVEIKGGTITPHKTDVDTMEQKPQGEATLEGAVYEIYRESDNLMVGTVTTDKEGNATSDYLPSLGRFYLKEKKPSTGYELDSTKYYFEITTDNLFPEIDVYERVISLTFDITKVYANEKTGIMTPEPNVKFGFYNNKGELVKEATTGANGNIKVKLPYGTYTAKQLTSTQDHEKVKDFTLEVKESGDDVKMVISNAEITAKFSLEQAENEYDLENAAILRHGTIPKLEKQLEDLRKSSENKLLSNVVTNDDIAKIIAKWTNIPITKLMSSEKEKLLHLEDNMKKRVMGQDEAIKLVSEAILKSRSGIKDPNRPIGSFLFLGPTGVGKTEIARTLAYELFDDEKHMIRIDMSGYMEKFSVSRLIGSPPGYVGYEEGGQLTEAVRRNPYSIVLFDEVEKAHPEVLNLLLQILDDGRITDSNGRTVDFKNTIIIMTSNIGSSHILEGHSNLVLKELTNYFRPEFINRIDEVIVFNSLDKNSVSMILDKILKEIELRLSNLNIHITITDKARKNLVDEGYDINFGARPLKRCVSRIIESKLAKMIINNEIKINSNIEIDYENNDYIIKKI